MIHAHQESLPRPGGRLVAATLLNIGMVVVELSYGFLAGSTALIADATHNAGDVIGLALAWIAFRLASQKPWGRFTYGLRSSTILAALLNGMLLMGAIGAIILDALGRLAHPVPVDGGTVMIVAAVAVALNAFSAWILRHGQKDLNVRGAFWHLVADAAVSAGVVIAGFLMIETGIAWLDPAASIVISAVIAFGTWRLFSEALNLSLRAVPASIDISAVRAYLMAVPGIECVHDLHVWAIGTADTALTCHCTVGETFDPVCLRRIAEELGEKFGINHATIQTERSDGSTCTLEPDAI